MKNITSKILITVRSYLKMVDLIRGAEEENTEALSTESYENSIGGYATHSCHCSNCGRRS